MRTSHISAMAAMALLTFSVLAQAQGGYSYETVDYPGTPFTQLWGINGRGDVAGNGADLVTFPFVYDSKKGGFTDVPAVSDYDETAVLAISDAGHLVGSVFNEDPLPFGMERGLIIDKRGNVTVFDHPDAVSFTQARGINNKGLVSGFRDSSDPDVVVGFIYDPSSGDFTDIVPSLFTIAQSINSRGDVVGSAIFLPGESPCPSDSPVPRFGWLRKADGDLLLGQRFSDQRPGHYRFGQDRGLGHRSQRRCRQGVCGGTGRIVTVSVCHDPR